MPTSTAVLSVGAVLLLSLTACGKEQPADVASDSGPSGYAAGGPQGAPDFAGPPGAMGEVADVTGRTMQVQNPASGQVAVTWTARTTFTEQVAASLKEVSVGDCVMVTSASASSSDSTGPIAADTVRITPAVDGECAPAVGRGGAPGGPGGPGQLMTSAPEGMPTDLPTDLPDGVQRFEGPAGAFGRVTAVSPSGFTVESSRASAPGATEPTTAAVVVTVSSDTSYTTTAKATSSAVKVGVCVDARGEEDSTGAITAVSVAVSPKVGGQCGSFGLGGPVLRQGA